MSTITDTLLTWHHANPRPLPWKNTRDPYKIWLSEIILQQTRVEQGLPYYQRFVEAYPTVNDLAAAPDDEVMKLWEGLGYYSRARNLLAAARYVATELKGDFPNTYDGLLRLKGVGEYTAAAIASFAFGLPHAVVDGNVYRVLSRIYGIETPIDSPQAKKEFTALANELLDKERPDVFNQAIMDFGATHCKPAQPLCNVCPMKGDCVAFLNGKVASLPIKSKKMEKKTRYLYFLDAREGASTFIERRPEGDIWAHLYQFPLIETERFYLEETFFECSEWTDFVKEFGLELKILNFSLPFRHVLTHRNIVAVFVRVEIIAKNNSFKNKYLEIDLKNISDFALPILFKKYL